MASHVGNNNRIIFSSNASHVPIGRELLAIKPFKQPKHALELKLLKYFFL